MRATLGLVQDVPLAIHARDLKTGEIAKAANTQLVYKTVCRLSQDMFIGINRSEYPEVLRFTSVDSWGASCTYVKLPEGTKLTLEF
jgi:hypothetical protein